MIIIIQMLWVLVYGVVCYGIGRFWFGLLKVALPAGVQPGAGLLLGMATLAGQLAIYSMLHIPFSGYTLYLPWGILFSWSVYRRWQKKQLNFHFQISFSKIWSITTWPEKILVLLCSCAIFTTFLNQVTSPSSSWDSIAMWLYRAKQFYLSGSFDQVLGNLPPHPDYPIAHPLVMTSFYLFGVGLQEQVALGLTTLYSIAAMTLLYGYSRQYLPGWISICLPLLMFGVPNLFIMIFSPAYLAYADYQLGCVMLLFGVFFALWLQNRQPQYLALTIISLAFAASIKNEGVTFLFLGGMAILAGLAINFREIKAHLKAPSVWVSLAITLGAVGGWALYIRMQNYELDISSGFKLDRFLEQLPLRQSKIFQILGDYLKSDIKYTALGVIVVICLTSVLFIRNKRSITIYLLLGVLLGQATLYLVIYVVTIVGLEWQIATTWSRLLTHLTPLLFLIFSLTLGNLYLLLPKKLINKNTGETSAKPAPFSGIKQNY